MLATRLRPAEKEQEEKIPYAKLESTPYKTMVMTREELARLKAEAAQDEAKDVRPGPSS